MEVDWARGLAGLPGLGGAPAVAPEPRGVVKRGIVVTHGVGSQRRGEQLDTVLEPLVAFLSRSLGQEQVRVTARTTLDEHKVADAIIYLGPPEAEQPFEEWHVREAWWAESFHPSQSGTALVWALRAAVTHVAASARSVVVTNLLAMRGKRQGTGVWRIPVSGFWFQAMNVASWLFIVLGYILAYLIGAVLLLPLMVLLQAPLRWFMPGLVGEVQRALVDFVTGGIGDQHATTNRRVAVAAAATTVASALWPFLAPEARKRRDFDFDTVTVIAHSGGCVVSYEALAGEEVRRWMRAMPQPRLTWITVGSGLNLGWRMRAPWKDRDRVFWSRRIDDHVNWIDIYARYDPVPQGAVPAALVHALVGERTPPYASVRVANDDWPLSDHGAYWQNFEEVLPRLVHAITDSRLGWQTRDEIGRLLRQQEPAEEEASYAKQRDEMGFEHDHRLAWAVRDAVEGGGPQRRRRVAALRFASVVATVLLAWSAWPVGRWLLEWRLDVLAWSLAPADVVPLVWLGFDLTAARPLLAGALGLAVLVFLLYMLWRVARSGLEWLRPERDRRSFIAAAETDRTPGMVGGKSADLQMA
ncbi:MAG TPA: hypothetical protein VHS99_05920 [Chloroflexota bacterium]|nr:hypothetical protein [Chloroflexota bacterium]